MKKDKFFALVFLLFTVFVVSFYLFVCLFVCSQNRFDLLVCEKVLWNFSRV